MIDREIWHAIVARVQALLKAAQELEQFLNALTGEAERSSNRIRELAGELPQPTTGNGGKRRGRPPSGAKPEGSDTSAPAKPNDGDVTALGQ
jgi:hypothetical protein